MAEPITISTGTATSVITGVTLAGLIPGIDPGIIIAAFAGSVIFVLSAVDFPIWQRAFLFGVSMITGVYCAEFTASIVSSLLSAALREPIHAAAPIGATLASAAAVRVLMMFSAKPKDGGSVFDRFRNKGDGT
ncbi:putative holin [Limnobaculum xujianqingii]|uniref:putative holin n=1 Tax=Limnobaculum xujianqingii TaxID=2738837 RepID=UPI001128B656|nr:putative holin [Limnobaculum xujianqingii]